MSDRPAMSDDDAEREVDLRALKARLVARWWLLLAGLVIGAVLGILLAAGGGQTWRAQTLLYLGQPFTTSGGGQIQSLATNPRTVSEIVRSEFALRRAAAASGLRLSQLRGHVASAAVVSAAQSKNTSPLVEITVEGAARLKVERAADALAGSVIAQVSTYVDRKIKLLDDQIASSVGELTEINARVTLLQNQLATILANKSLSATERLIAVGNLNATLGFAEQHRGTVQQEEFQNQQLLSLAQNVERSKIVQPAAASRVTATSRRNAAAIGALIGLLLGAIAAYLGDPLAARRNRPAPA